MSYVDARLLELQFLARLEREGEIEITELYDGSAERKMIISLVYDGYINGPDTHDFEPHKYDVTPYEVDKGIQADRIRAVGTLLSKTPLPGGWFPVRLQISHKGRVRRSELEQQIKVGRDRDPTKLCWAKRHFLTDLAVALTTTDKDAPVSVVSIDMNGMKAINDAHDHHTADEAIYAYLEAVVATFSEHGEAYRGEGGDEAMVILPGVDDERAGKLLDTFVRQLGKDVLMLDGTPHRLTASAGSRSTTDPKDVAATLFKSADKVMSRAKTESRKCNPRVSAFTVGDNGEVTTHDPGAP